VNFTDKALEAFESDSNQNTTAPEQSDTQSDQDISPGLETKQRDQDTQEEAQAILDLAQVGKFKINGQDMTYEDLQKAMLRQQDYTKKTQELAGERKFIDNLRFDLESVKGDPRLAEKFKQIYPEKYHGYLAFALNQQQTQAPQGLPTAQLPPELAEKLEQHERMLSEFRTESQAATSEALDSMFSSLESDLQKKYKLADLTHVYGMVENYIAENQISSKDMLKNKEATQKMFEQFTKASHDAVTKRYKEFQQEELQKAKQVNAKASDIGRGGGTATAPPVKLKLKDVADMMVNDLNQ